MAGKKTLKGAPNGTKKLPRGAIVQQPVAQLERRSQCLQAAFLGTCGFSPQSIWRMRAFYLASFAEFLAQPAREMKAGKKVPQPVAETSGMQGSLLRSLLDERGFEDYTLDSRPAGPLPQGMLSLGGFFVALGVAE